MITSTTNNNVFSLAGLSTDTKPIGGIIENGSTFYEIDTCKTYIYDKANQVWVAQKSTVPVVIDVTSDMIDSEDATIGQVLTADGSGGADWQDIPETKTYKSFDVSWTTDGTTAAFCEDLLADSSVVPANVYLGEVTFSDKPFVGNTEVVVEVQEGPVGGVGKALHLILTSGSDAPYHWEYTYWKVSGTASTSGWIGFQPELTDNSVSSGTVVDALGFDNQGNLIKGQISSGSTVIANPVLVGTETELTGLQIDNTKYKISGGGGGGSTYYQEKVLCDVTSKQELYDLIDNSNEMFKSFLSTVPGEGSYNLYDNLMTRTGFYVKFKSSATFVNEEDESDTLTLSDIGLSNAEIRGYCGFHELCNYWDTYFSGLAYDGGIRINICAYVDNQYIGELYLSMSVTEVVEEVEESTYTISFDTVELETNSGEKRYALIAEDNTDWFDVIDELVVFM